MNKKHYGTPALVWIELHEADVVRTSLTQKDVTSDDIYGEEVWS